jgi:SAM-dependent methyltransferase
MNISKKVETVACDFCSCDKSVPVTQQTDLLHHTTDEVFTIVRCTGCGLQYTNPRPTPTQIGRYYAPSYSFHDTPSDLRLFAYRVAQYVANTAILASFAGMLPGIGKRLVPFVKPSITDPVRSYYTAGGDGTMLDIGCGSGASANFWGMKGALLSYSQITNVVGVEINDLARESLAAKGIEVLADIENIANNRLFGMIRMNWSLEHVHSPSRYFQFIRDHLKKGGRAVIAVPNYEGLIYQLAPDCVELPVHLYHFRPRDIENYARRYGLRILELNTFSYPGMFVGGAQAGMFSAAFSTNFGLHEARNFQSVLTRFDRAGWGNDMIVVLTGE